MDIKIELSTICFQQDNVLEKIAQCRELIESHGFTFGVQLHNSVTKGLYEKIKGLGVGFTVHAPVFSDYFINLAHDDFDVVLSGFRNTTLIMKELHSSIVLFHGFFMTHKPIKNDPANYGKVLRDAIDNKYRLGDTRVMDPRFLETEEYKGFQQTVKKNMRLLRESYPAYIICLENDFPGIGNGNQTPAHLIFLDCPIWLDVGHLWASSILNKFDFYVGLDAVCKQCNVIGVHLNTNDTPHNWDFKYPSGDTHSHFSVNSDMDMGRVIGILAENRITHFTIEITDGNKDDILFLIQQHRISSQKA